MRKLSLICFVVLFAFSFFACEENGGNGGGGVSEVIGPEGGTITSKDGRLMLTFPPGALPEDTEITITDINGGEARAKSDGLEPQFTYNLEPDGIEFNVPVTASFLLDEKPVQGDGSIATEGALLFTSSNGEFEVLANLTQDVNADENTTTVSGELSHFSDLSEAADGLILTVSGVPDIHPANSPFTANLLAQGQQDNIQITEQLIYRDFSVAPVLYLGEQPLRIGTDPTGSSAESPLPYKCGPPGTGKYASRTTITFRTFFFGGQSNAHEYRFFVSKGVMCEGPPSPTPPPVEPCAQVGTYNSQSAGCGIGTFTVSDITSGELTVTGFGANPGDVKFMQLPLEPTVFSSNSDNLIIFGQNGHECTLTCGPGEDQLTLDCEDPPNMCTEVFTLQE
ncbi:MAG: hypothetical protein AB1598_08280 [Thermodesulfobacteriota bacterium]